MAHFGTAQPVLTAKAAGLIGCKTCGRANEGGAEVCARCGSQLVATPNLQAVWAWLAAGMVVYVPANLYPMMRTSTLGRSMESTIFGGVLELLAMGSYGIAAIVFVASIVIPVAKFVLIAYLAWAVQTRKPMHGRTRYHLYEAVEFVGRWSMIDVFVVAILSALVQFDLAASISPGIAAASFALSVAFTMLSAQSFDPRLIWQATDAEPHDQSA